MSGPRAIEAWLVFLIVAHSLGVAAGLLLLPDWSAEFGGWGTLSQKFFARQAGVFHLVVAFGYLYEYLRYRGITLLVLAKSVAVIFLLWSWLLAGESAWAVPLSALADGMMAVMVLAVHRWVKARRH
jgi:hypothetical protein